MQPIEKSDAVHTTVTLTEDQRDLLAQALGIKVEFVPQQLGVVGIPETNAKTLGMPKDMRGRFSPSVVLT